MRVPLLVLLAFAAAGCSGPTEVDLGEDFTLAIGGSATIEGTRVTVTFEDVLDDSRCPVNADCLWPGEARVRLAVNTPARRVVLYTRSDANYAIVYQDGLRQLVIHLGTLLPLPSASGPIDKRAYRATLNAIWWERLEG
jgi:hypothetical protein